MTTMKANTNSDFTYGTSQFSLFGLLNTIKSIFKDFQTLAQVRVVPSKTEETHWFSHIDFYHHHKQNWAGQPYKPSSRVFYTLPATSGIRMYKVALNTRTLRTWGWLHVITYSRWVGILLSLFSLFLSYFQRISVKHAGYLHISFTKNSRNGG